jgi:probable HAF family extracellular repeat protein
MLRLATLLLATVAAACAAPTYMITNLGTLPGGSSSFGNGVNNAGHATGFANTPDGPRAYYWNGSTMLPLPFVGDGSESYGNAINNANQITGYGQTSVGQRAFVWDATTNILLQLNALDGRGINDAGHVAGYGVGLNGFAFLYDGSVVTSLGTLPGDFLSSAADINASGQIVGDSFGGGGPKAFLYDNGTLVQLAIAAPDGATAFGINDAGQVAGSAFFPSGVVPFLWANGATTFLPILSGGSNGFGVALNNAGDVVGWTDLGTGPRATLWRDGMALDLLSLVADPTGWELSDAVDISDTGYVVGTGYYQGEQRAFLLTPTAVPEPSTWVLFTFALVLIALRGRRFER